VQTFPSGAGKSTLLKRLVEIFGEAEVPQRCDDPSRIVILYTVAVASGHRAFDFRRLYRDALKALRDPFAATRGRSSNEPKVMLHGETRGSARLREDLEEEMRARGVMFWIIDEAHHIVRGGKSGAPGDQYDILKSLAQTTHAKLVLSGTYDLPEFLASSGQLARRSETVQIARYQWTNPTDRDVFLRVVNKLFKTMGLRGWPDVKGNGEALFAGAIGCVGIFKDWAARALALALQQDADVLTMEHMHATRLSHQQLETILDDIEEGEAFMALFGETEVDASLLNRILRGSDKPPTRSTSHSPPRSTRKPGERAVGRDPVGVAP
jgi:AAA domain